MLDKIKHYAITLKGLLEPYSIVLDVALIILLVLNLIF